MKTFAALFGGSVVHVLGDADPVVGALRLDEVDEQLVLFRDPGSAAV